MYARLITKLSWFMLITTLIPACANNPQNVTESPTAHSNFKLEVIEDIIYSSDDWPQALGADLYLPKTEGLRPVVLMVHGGGWSGRDRSDMDSTAKKLAKRGYAVLNVSYRFAPEFTYPAPVQDLQLALLWLQNNAEIYQLDLNRINAWGYSSGAHLVTQLASVKPGEAQTLDLSPPLPTINAVVAGGTPADLSRYKNSPIVIPFLGAKRDENPQLYREASPINHISSTTPPIFLYHGKRDKLVEKEQSINYYNALRQSGVPAELYLDPWWGHITMFLFGWEAEGRAIDFLDKYNF